MASAAASNHYTTAGSIRTTFNYQAQSDTIMPKFSQYRSRVMLGDLPNDFLRIKLSEPIAHRPEIYQMPTGYINQAPNPNFLGYLTLTIAEAKLTKSSGILGLVKMDPYVSFRIGHVQYETPTAAGGGKNPQWKASYRLNLFKGMDRIYFEVFDQRNFTEDAFIGECEVIIPAEVMAGETRQNWYPLMSRGNKENQGDLLVILSFAPTSELMFSETTNHQAVNSAVRVNPQPTASNASSIGVHADHDKNVGAGVATGQSAAASNSPTHRPNELYGINQQSSSVIPKPPPPPYSQEDIQTIQEMFPTTDRRIIINLLDANSGNKDAVVNQLLQNMP